MAFSPEGDFLALSSDKGTVHVYVINARPGQVMPAGPQDEAEAAGGEAASPSQRKAPGNKSSTFSMIKGILPKYFSSEWSFAQFRLPESTPTAIVAFGAQKDALVVVGTNGAFFKCAPSPAEGP